MPNAVWSYGFRPFFLGAGALAALIIPWWAGALAWGIPLGTIWPPSLWHGHEMLFGFIGAAIAGFLLTAVPSWTGERGFAGTPLIVLATLWVLGRAAAATSALWPPFLVAGLDLLFLPALASLVLPPIVRAGNRNTPLLAVLAALWGADIAFHWGLFHQDEAFARRALFTGIDVVLLLVTVIGGRIIPSFTNSALRQNGMPSGVSAWRVMTPLAVSAMLALTVIDLWSPESRVAGLLAAGAAVIQAVRLAQWQGFRTLRAPIVWVLGSRAADCLGLRPADGGRCRAGLRTRIAALRLHYCHNNRGHILDRGLRGVSCCVCTYSAQSPGGRKTWLMPARVIPRPDRCALSRER